ncbi:MAG: serine protease [Amphiplicatus sp.]
MRRELIFAAIVFIGALTIGGRALAQEGGPSCQAPAEALTSFGIRRNDLAIVLRKGDKPARLEGLQSYRYVRFFVEVSNWRAAQWRLVIRDIEARPLQVIDKTHLAARNEAAGAKSAVWTRRFGDLAGLSFELVADGPQADDVIVRFPEYVAVPAQRDQPFYSIFGDEPAWREVHKSGLTDAWRKRSDSVGMIFAGRERENWCCSGVVIGWAGDKDVLFLTNDHCGAPVGQGDAWSPQACESAIVDFSWDGDAIPWEYSCARAKRLPELDLAVLRLQPTPGMTDARPPPARFSQGRARDVAPPGRKELTIFHHAQCGPKFVTDQCEVIGYDRPGRRAGGRPIEFAHRCDTESGSSGAPIFGYDGAVLGVHRAGFLEEKNGCTRENFAIDVTQQYVRERIDAAVASLAE